MGQGSDPETGLSSPSFGATWHRAGSIALTPVVARHHLTPSNGKCREIRVPLPFRTRLAFAIQSTSGWPAATDIGRTVESAELTGAPRASDEPEAGASG
jgi:hypothetical protein